MQSRVRAERAHKQGPTRYSYHETSSEEATTPGVTDGAWQLQQQLGPRRKPHPGTQHSSNNYDTVD
eukprot:10745149-Lingulodinium_polyedra.AAC.1